MNLSNSQNQEQYLQLLARIADKHAQVKWGGGEKKINAQHSKGKLTARERIHHLLDPDSESVEIGALAANAMYVEEGGCPSAGVVVVIGKIAGRMCVVVANDATVKAGAWFPMTAKKNLRAQEIAIENHLPIVYLVDSAGVYLPMQDEIFPDKEHFGRQFRNNAIMSSMGIVQIAAIMGSCVAGGAYLPIMADEALIVDKTGSIFLAGSYLVKAAIGEEVDNERLGGASTHCEISGVTDNKYGSDEECLDAIHRIFERIGDGQKAGFNRDLPQLPAKNPEEFPMVFPVSRVQPYDMMEIIDRLVDAPGLEQYKKDYGKTLICGYARIDGWAVGIVANQRLAVKAKKGQENSSEMQMGGVIYSDAADKAARFIMNCNQRKIPLVFLQDVNGFMVGSRAEHGGIIKDGAKMVNAVANSVVPKFTVVLGSSYGAGNYAMCGRAYDPRLMVAWPTAEMAVMSGNSASKTLLQIKVAALKARGSEISEKDQQLLLDEIQDSYREKLNPVYAAARLWVDAVIDPQDTRNVISLGIEAANHAPIERQMNVGVIQ
ncbi:MAG: acyl-CoA carboxylase subunit beta, partial [Cyclobacteriaceae bacterium]|nr:acyl-CoA carboxylase subunit beta [Cyclobacteriaceae bacterium]